MVSKSVTEIYLSCFQPTKYHSKVGASVSTFPPSAYSAAASSPTLYLGPTTAKPIMTRNWTAFAARSKKESAENLTSYRPTWYLRRRGHVSE